MSKILSHHLNIVSGAESSFLDIIKDKGYEINFLSENCFTVKFNNLFLTAFPNGDIKFSSIECNAHEKFYILDKECEIFLNESIKRKYAKNYELIINNNKLQILLNLKVITPSFLPFGKYNSYSNTIEYVTLHETIKITNSKTLIYFCVYGDEKYYECFFLALTSLIQKGKYEGDVLIKTDNPDKVKNYCKNFKNNFYISNVIESLGIFNRYVLDEPYLSNYSKIIYFDSDILTTNPIEYFLKNIDKEKSDFLIYKEFPKSYEAECINRGSPWFGLDLLKNVHSIKEHHVLNSGFFIINNLDAIKPVFKKVLDYRYFEDIYGDQPFLNLALYNLDIIIKKLEYDDEISFCRSYVEAISNIDKTLIHFNSGVGNLSKLELMNKVWEKLI